MYLRLYSLYNSIVRMSYHLWLPGNDEMDVDIPSKYEAQLFKYTFGKLIWMFLQPFFYALRPLFIQPKPPTLNEVSLVINLFLER